PVLISAPLPTSIQFTFVPAASSIQPSPLAIINGLVLRKNAIFTCAGAARTIAGIASVVAPTPAVASSPRLVMFIVSINCPPSLLACPMHDPCLDRNQQPIEHNTHRPDDQDPDEHVIGPQEPPSIQDHPADTIIARDDLGRDQRPIDDADGQTCAGEDLC